MTAELSTAGQHRRALITTFALTFTYFIVEVVGRLHTNSLVLLADTAHILTKIHGDRK